MGEILNVVLRSVTIYLFIVLAIRLFGKKELAQLSVVDLVFILLISNAVQNAMIGSDTSLLAGIIAATSLFAVNMVLKIVLLKSPRLSKFFQGNPLMLIYKGKVIEKHLKQAMISQSELEEVVREHGVENIKEVDLAVFETDGNISVLSHNYRKKSTRRRKAHKIISKNF